MIEYSVIGLILETPETYDDSGAVLTESVYKDGFHVNSTEITEDLKQYQIFPENPVRIYAGDKSGTVFLKFKDSDEWNDVLNKTTQED